MTVVVLFCVCVKEILFLCSDAEKQESWYLSVPHWNEWKCPPAVLLIFIVPSLPHVVLKCVFLDRAHILVVLKRACYDVNGRSVGEFSM